MADQTGGVERREAPAPVGARERVHELDTLRGVAVLGILAMNLPDFALSRYAYFTPPVDGGFEGVNYAVWLFNHLVFDLKMMGLFSLLFGAGIVLFAQRREATGGRAAELHYRRMLALLAIGLAHAYFVWSGDILVSYALCGMLVYPARRLRPEALLAIGFALLLVAIPISASQGWRLTETREEARLARIAIADPGPDGGETPERLEAIRVWEEGSSGRIPTEEALASERWTVRNDPVGHWHDEARESWWWQTTGMAVWGVWRIGGLMLMGMGLFKLGVLAGRRSTAFYAAMTVAGYAAGFPLILRGVREMHAQGFDVPAMLLTIGHYNYVGSLFVVAGHIGVVMLTCRSRGLVPALRPLAAVGRMAFTNYLAQSVICALIFYGWGLGWWGRLERWQLALMVLAIWGLQLAWSTWWLGRHRFGPAEWLWRSLTYGRAQPMARIE